jgi:hypothetical protein
MRGMFEIQRAHDLITGILLSPLREKFQPSEIAEMVATANVLCWILRHEHNQTLAAGLEFLENFLRKEGLQVIDSGKLIYPDARPPL